MTVNSEAAIDAIAEEVGRKIPTLEQFAAITDPKDMGPDVTIPAIWMALLLTRIRGLKASVELRDMQLKGVLPLTPTPITADDMGNYAGSLAGHAVQTMDSDRVDAAAVLFQAGVAILMATLPRQAVIDAMSTMVDFFDLRSILGIGEVRQ